MKIIAALGNPGEKYQNTRHNIAWLMIDNYLGEVKWSENKKFRALVYQDGEYLFLKPLTFMNESGFSVRAALDFYKLLPKSFGFLNKKNSDIGDSLLIIHDDLDIDFEKNKISFDSSSGGHNGIKSIINHLKTQKFKRLRLGIKNDLLRKVIPADKFVLQNFNKEEKDALLDIFKNIDIKKII